MRPKLAKEAMERARISPLIETKELFLHYLLREMSRKWGQPKSQNVLLPHHMTYRGTNQCLLLWIKESKRIPIICAHVKQCPVVN